MKKKVIISAIVIAVIIGVLVYMHYTPVWVSISNSIVFIAGLVIGWFAKVIYNKYYIHG